VVVPWRAVVVEDEPVVVDVVEVDVGDAGSETEIVDCSLEPPPHPPATIAAAAAAAAAIRRARIDPPASTRPGESGRVLHLTAILSR
jgi:hypothetical protein